MDWKELLSALFTGLVLGAIIIGLLRYWLNEYRGK